MTRSWPVVAMILLGYGCSTSGADDGPRPSLDPGSDAGGDAGGPTNGGDANAGVGAEGGHTGDEGSENGGNGESPVLDAPEVEPALLAFLDAKQYSNWAKEADYHPSAGPHGDAVRVFYSPKAARALAGGAETFPAGAAAVKELSSEGSLIGWSVWVKVQDATDAGNGFYWYEVVRRSDGKESVYGNARGSRDCVPCHAGGKDYDLSTLPFE